MKVQDGRVIKTKKTLHQSLVHLLQQKSLAEITVTELCKGANITRRTFYLHYESVPHIFEEQIKKLLADLEDSFLKTAKNRRLKKEGKTNPDIILLFQHVYDNKHLYKLIFSSKSNFSYYKIFLEKIKTLIRTSIQSTHLLKDVNEFELSYQANAILGLIIEWCNQNFKVSVTFMNKTLMSILKIDD